jgi:hypothetical protein
MISPNTSPEKITNEKQELIKKGINKERKGKEVIDQQKANVDKLNEFKNKLSSTKDLVEFVKIWEEIV